MTPHERSIVLPTTSIGSTGNAKPVMTNQLFNQVTIARPDGLCHNATISAVYLIAFIRG